MLNVNIIAHDDADTIVSYPYVGSHIKHSILTSGDCRAQAERITAAQGIALGQQTWATDQQSTFLTAARQRAILGQADAESARAQHAPG